MSETRKRNAQSSESENEDEWCGPRQDEDENLANNNETESQQGTNERDEDAAGPQIDLKEQIKQSNEDEATAAKRRKRIRIQKSLLIY